MKLLLVLVSLVAAAFAAISVSGIVGKEWEAYKREHRKIYKSVSEDRFRMNVYMEKRLEIAQHNERYDRGLESFRLRLNQFSDLLHSEYLNIYCGNNQTLSNRVTGRRRTLGRKTVSWIEPANVKVLETVDWRIQGAVTPVKNQGNCASCWAFSTTGSLEGQYFRKTDQLVSFSVQNLIDCSTPYGNKGCDGGNRPNSFRYIYDYGIDTEKSYPYTAKQGPCAYNPNTVGAKITGYVHLPSGDEDALKKAVATVGPVSISMDPSQKSFQSYGGGVYYEPRCNNVNLIHAMLVVGYGTTDQGEDYWLVKNSWGTRWGIQGYIKMARNRNNNCGIASAAYYPRV